MAEARTAGPKQWHWQERLDDGGAPDEACRAQLHQLRECVSYRAWLKQKRTAASSRARSAKTEESGEDDADKRARSEAAFREWRARKSRESKAKQPPTRSQDKAGGKPPSLHVNPKLKRAKQAQTKSDGNSSTKHFRQPEAEAAAAYDAWMARVRLEDRVRRSQRRQERAEEAAKEREEHANKWKKKLVVYAYSASCST